MNPGSAIGLVSDCAMGPDSSSIEASCGDPESFVQLNSGNVFVLVDEGREDPNAN